MQDLTMARALAAASLTAILALAGCNQESSESLLEQGKADLERQEPKTAIVRLKLALKGQPDSAEARYLLGRAMLEAGDPTAAAIELEKALTAGYDRNAALPRLARALTLSGQARKLTNLHGDVELQDARAQASYKAALAEAWAAQGEVVRTEAAVAAALKAVPDYAPAQVIRARLMVARGDVDGGLALVDQLLAREPRLYEGWHLKGQILAGVRRDETAATEAFRTALSIETAHLPSHMALFSLAMGRNDLAAAKAQVAALRESLPSHPQGLFAEAQIAFAEKDDKKLRENVQILLRGAPQHVGILQLAGAMEGRAGALVVAESHFAKALQIDPELPYARRNLARVYLLLGRTNRALETIHPRLEADPNDGEALAIAGEALLKLGNAKEAEDLLRRAAALSPADARVRSGIALAQLERGESTQGFAALESIAKESADTVADLALVSAHMKRREYDAALAAVDRLIAKQPGSASAYELRGQVLTTRRDLVGARQAFEKALAIDPRLFSVTASLAALDLAERKPEQARTRIEEAVKADPENHHARVVLATILGRTGAPYEQVRDTLLQAIKMAPSDPTPRLLLVQAAIGARRHKEAVTYAQEAMAVMPNDLDVLDALGRAQMHSGDSQQAIATFRRITGVDPNSARAHVRLADIMKSSGNRFGAIASMRRALELEPDLEPARAGLVELLVAEGRGKEALDMARELQRRQPQSASGYLLEGAVHRRLKAPEAAVSTYRTGLQKAQAKDELARALYRTLGGAGRVAEADRFAADWLKEHPQDAAMQYHWAVSHVLRGDLPTAERLLRSALELRPDHPMALNNLAAVLTAQGKPGALPLAQKAAELLPNQPAVMDTLAMALAADRQTEKALELQKKAVEMSPAEPTLRLNLARIAIQAGDKLLARSELERLSSMGDRLPNQAEVQSLLRAL